MVLREAFLCFLILMGVAKKFFPQVSAPSFLDMYLFLACLAFSFPLFSSMWCATIN